MEFFGREALLADLELRSVSNRKPEAIIQAHTDRFLFAEGFFPITHASAGDGEIDTFIETEKAHLFSRAEESREMAILLELKQVIQTGTKKKVTPKAVREAVVKAKAQAQEYRKHLRTKPRWADHEVFALVAYDGPKRYRSDEQDVLLVYLGDATPSAGSEAL